MQLSPKSLLPSIVALASLLSDSAGAADAPPWTVGTPIVTYWAGPGFPGGGPLDDAAAKQLVEGGWNLVWCHEGELDTAHRHGLRGLLTDPLLAPESLDDPEKRLKLDALIGRVSGHPGMYAYHLTDEPSAVRFPALDGLVSYLREKDPAHLAYINLLPTYANNEQLGTPGATVEAYSDYLTKFVATVKPGLLSYDHYQFTNSHDNPDYFLNLAMVKDRALASGVPFLNIVQASNWVPGTAASPSSPRVPKPEEMRYLVYTTLAYGAQGISYYVYSYPAHEGGMARLSDRTPTPLYDALKPLNREFIKIATILQPLKLLGVSHEGMKAPGTSPLPEDSTFSFDPPVPAMDYKSGDRVQGLLLSRFGPAAGAACSHVMVVNLDYKQERTVRLKGPGPLEVFDASSGDWQGDGKSEVHLELAGGAGSLIRLSGK